MTRGQFEKAEKLNEEIQKYDDLISRINQGISYKTGEDEKARERIERMGRGYNDHNERWTLSKFFGLRFKEQKVIAIPHYEFAQGVEIEADAELVGLIVDYFQKKKDACEEEFKRIGGNEE